MVDIQDGCFRAPKSDGVGVPEGDTEDWTLPEGAGAWRRGGVP